MKDTEIQTMNLSNGTVQPVQRRIAQTEPVGARLRAIRKLKSVSLAHLARTTGLAFSTVQAVEVRSDPRLSTLLKICMALDVQMTDVLDADRFLAALAKIAEGSDL